MTQRTAAKVLTSATLTATLAGILIGATFRRCAAEEGREHGPPALSTASLNDNITELPLTPASAATLAASALLIATPAHPAIHNIAPRGVELRHALVKRTVTQSFWGIRERYTFTSQGAATSADREERQREQVAIHLGRAVSRRGDDATARIESIYRNLRVARWGSHADGLLGGHFNFDYSAVHCVDLDRMMPHGRYGRFASLHFHHDQERVHVDAANPFGMAGVLVPAHFFLDVVAGHLRWPRGQ